MELPARPRPAPVARPAVPAWQAAASCHTPPGSRVPRVPVSIYASSFPPGRDTRTTASPWARRMTRNHAAAAYGARRRRGARRRWRARTAQCQRGGSDGATTRACSASAHCGWWHMLELDVTPLCAWRPSFGENANVVVVSVTCGIASPFTTSASRTASGSAVSRSLRARRRRRRRRPLRAAAARRRRPRGGHLDQQEGRTHARDVAQGSPEIERSMRHAHAWTTSWITTFTRW